VTDEGAPDPFEMEKRERAEGEAEAEPETEAEPEAEPETEPESESELKSETPKNAWAAYLDPKSFKSTEEVSRPVTEMDAPPREKQAPPKTEKMERLPGDDIPHFQRIPGQPPPDLTSPPPGEKPAEDDTPPTQLAQATYQVWPPKPGTQSMDHREARQLAEKPEAAQRRRRWWQRPDPGEPAKNLVSHMGYNLAYEVVQAVTTAVVLGTLAFTLLGGQFADLYIWLRGPAPVSDDVRLVTISEEALYLWYPENPEPQVTPRGLLAELVRFLDEAGARVVVLDFLLDRPAAGDDELIAAARAHGAVVSAERFTVSEPVTGREFVRGTAPTLSTAIAAGVANFQEEQNQLFPKGDLLVRRAPLVRRVARASLSGAWPGNMDGAEQTDAEIRPAMALLGAWLYVGRESDRTVRADDLLYGLEKGCGGNPLQCELTLADLGLPPAPTPLHEPLEINYRGPEWSAEGIPTVRAAQVLRALGEAAMYRGLGIEVPMVPEELGALLDDKLVVVCRTDEVAAAAGDRFVTPYSFPLFRSADMAGGRVQAQVIDNLLAGTYVHHVPRWLTIPLTLLLLAAVWFSRKALRDDVHSVLWLLSCGVLVALGALLFRVTDGVVLDLGLPIAASLITLVLLRFHAWARER